MKCKVEKSKLNGEIVCPANKSYTHRGVFLAALSDGKSIIKKSYVLRILRQQLMHVVHLELI